MNHQDEYECKVKEINDDDYMTVKIEKPDQEPLEEKVDHPESKHHQKSKHTRRMHKVQTRKHGHHHTHNNDHHEVKDIDTSMNRRERRKHKNKNKNKNNKDHHHTTHSRQHNGEDVDQRGIDFEKDYLTSRYSCIQGIRDFLYAIHVAFPECKSTNKQLKKYLDYVFPAEYEKSMDMSSIHAFKRKICEKAQDKVINTWESVITRTIKPEEITNRDTSCINKISDMKIIKDMDIMGKVGELEPEEVDIFFEHIEKINMSIIECKRLEQIKKNPSMIRIAQRVESCKNELIKDGNINIQAVFQLATQIGNETGEADEASLLSDLSKMNLQGMTMDPNDPMMKNLGPVIQSLTSQLGGSTGGEGPPQLGDMMAMMPGLLGKLGMANNSSAGTVGLDGTQDISGKIQNISDPTGGHVVKSGGSSDMIQGLISGLM